MVDCKFVFIMGMFSECRSKIRCNLNSIFLDIIYICAFNIVASFPGYAGEREMYQCDWWPWSKVEVKAHRVEAQGTSGHGSADIQVTQVTPAPSGCGCGRATETHSSSSMMRPGFCYGGRVISTREGDRMATEQAQALDKAKCPGKGKQ